MDETADANITLKCYAKSVPDEVRRSVQDRADRLEVGLTDSVGTVKPAPDEKLDTIN